MPDTRQWPGILNHIWIGGRFVAKNPVPVLATPRRFEMLTPTAGATIRADRMFLMPGQPNALTLYEFSLPWPDARSIDNSLLEHLDSIASTGTPFDFAYWKPEYEFFDGDNASTTFYASRRQAMAQIAPNPTWPHYPTRIDLFDRPYGQPGAIATPLTVTPKSSASINIGAPAAGVAWVENEGHLIGRHWWTTIRLGTAPGSLRDCLRIVYIPLFAVLLKTASSKTHDQTLVERRMLSLAEIG